MTQTIYQCSDLLMYLVLFFVSRWSFDVECWAGCDCAFDWIDSKSMRWIRLRTWQSLVTTCQICLSSRATAKWFFTRLCSSVLTRSWPSPVHWPTKIHVSLRNILHNSVEQIMFDFAACRQNVKSLFGFKQRIL